MGNEPVTRDDLRRALAVNAATKPVNVAVPAAVVVAGVLLGAVWLVAVAVIVYVALGLMTFFDEGEARRVGQAAYGRERPAPAAQLDARGFAPPIRAQLEAARAEQAAIGRAIAESDLGWADVRTETGALVTALEAAARRAQKLSDYLAAQDVGALDRRIVANERDGQAETAAALRTQRAEIVRLDGMLRSAYGEMEQVNASLRTVHARLVGASVSSAADAEADLAGDVRDLRHQVETLTEGLDTGVR